MIRLLFIFLVFLCNASLYSQNVEVIYKVNFQPKQHDKNFRTEYMKLQISGKISEFSPVTVHSDSLKKIDDDTYLNFNVLISNSTLKYYSRFSDLKYFFQEEVPTNWILSKQKSSRWNGYTTYEAKIKLDGREWTALYAPEIPVNSGPYKFSGLPGLILKISSDDGEYIFEMFQLRKVEDCPQIQQKFNNYQRITKRKLHQYINDFIKDPAARSILLVNSFGDGYDYVFKGKNTEDYRNTNQFMRDIINKFNNPIDRKTFILVF